MDSTFLTIAQNGVKLAMERWDVPSGTDRRGVIVLLHGGGQTRHSWSKSAAAFAGRGWTTYSVDARGHGDSDWAADADYSIDAMVDDLKAVIAEAGEPPVLVGASMGGMTSLIAAGEHPELARALVLVDIAARAEPEGVKRITDFMRGGADGFATLDDVAEAIRAYNPHRKRATNYEGLKKNVRQRADGRWYWHWDPQVMANGDEATRMLSEQRRTAAARNVRIPTLLVRGKSSDIVSPEAAKELLRLIPGSRMSQVEAGHMVAGDDNDVFSLEVGDFLDEVL